MVSNTVLSITLLSIALLCAGYQPTAKSEPFEDLSEMSYFLIITGVCLVATIGFALYITQK